MLASLARLAYRRRWLVVAAWGAVLVVGVLVGTQVFSRLTSGTGTRTDVESAWVERSLQNSGGLRPDLTILLDGQPADDPRLRQEVADLVRDLRGMPEVRTVVDAGQQDAGQDAGQSGSRAGLVATDGMAQIVAVQLRPGIPVADDQRIADEITARARHVAAPRVLVGGAVPLQAEFQTGSEKQLARGELIALPVILLLLLVIFRGVLPALLPLLVAAVSVVGALLVLLAVSYATTLSSYAVNVITMVGLGLAVDYALLLVSRFREERAAGGGVEDAVVRTVATAGRTVAFSAVTVTAALAGFLVFAEPLLRSMAWGAIGVVLLTGAASVTLIPAFLRIWGRRIRPAGGAGDHGAFSRLAGMVRRVAVVLAPLLAIGLLLLAAPVRHAQWGGSGPESLPRSSPTRQMAQIVQDRFPGGGAEPIVVVATTEPGSAPATQLAARLAALRGVAGVQPRATSPAGTTVIDVMVDGPTVGETAKRLVRDIRSRYTPVPVRVGGAAAALVDFQASVRSRLPWVLAVIVLATVALLFVMTGSAVVPVKAVVINVLSLGASFGALIWIFQQGHLASLLDFDPAGSIDSTVPLLIFVFAFGLSMDYEVFLLSRIKELYDRTGDSDRAVAAGLQRTGRIVTSAAALMIVVFLGFAVGGVLTIKELGIGMALTILVDATVVRCLLVPAVMTLMGRWNWWAPRSVRALYARVPIREHESELSPVPEKV